MLQTEEHLKAAKKDVAEIQGKIDGIREDKGYVKLKSDLKKMGKESRSNRSVYEDLKNKIDLYCISMNAQLRPLHKKLRGIQKEIASFVPPKNVKKEKVRLDQSVDHLPENL